MGGTFMVQLWTNNRAQHSRLIEEGLEKLSELENRLTDFKDSPFNQINTFAGKRAVAVDAETFQLIEKAQNFSRESGGVFDISYATVGALWREARRSGVLPDPQVIAERKKLINFQSIELNSVNLTVYLPDERMRIGLGGIGKGYAVDKLYQFLLEQGLVNFLVDGSGDVRVHSTIDAPRPWRLGIKNPFAEGQDKKIGYVALANGALATSGDYINYVRREDLDRKFHHVIDPLTGEPSHGIVSSTILAPTALEADLNATTVMIMEVTKALEWLKLKQLAGFLVKADGTVLMSQKAMQLMQGKQK